MPPYTYELHDRPGLEWTADESRTFILALRALATQCLSPLPEYQCLSLSSLDTLNDKVIAVARRQDTDELVAFCSALYIQVPDVGTVLHTGLTCVHPEERRSGLTIFLFGNLFCHMFGDFPDGLWLTTLAEVPSSLVSIFHIATKVHPSPDSLTPSPIHLQIANTVSASYRDAMFISPTATFDPQTFVFRESNVVGSPFRKSTEDPQLQHRNKRDNNFYRSLLNPNGGDEVLQVAFLDPEKMTQVLSQRITEVAAPEEKQLAKL